jgi:hypothetical protein
MTVAAHRGIGLDVPRVGGRPVALVNAAYQAFGTGLHAALYLAAALVIGAGILTAVTLRPSAREGRSR